MQGYVNENTCKILIGNKCDMTSERQVSTEEAKKKAEDQASDRESGCCRPTVFRDHSLSSEFTFSRSFACKVISSSQVLTDLLPLECCSWIAGSLDLLVLPRILALHSSSALPKTQLMWRTLCGKQQVSAETSVQYHLLREADGQLV